MGVFSVTRGVVPLLDQLVTVGGNSWDALWCSRISHGAGGIGTANADFAIPEALFDSYRANLRDQLVVVWCGYQGYTTAEPDFAGYLDIDAAELSPDDDMMHMQASSVTAYLRTRVFVGQKDFLPVVEYRLRDEVTGEATKWTPAKILKDIFANLPSEWATKISLGDTNALERPAEVEMPSVTFRVTPVGEAIEQIMGLLGDVGVRERYTSSGVTYLDFFRIDPSDANGMGTVPLVVADWQDVVTTGANVAAITHNQTSRGVVTRMIGYAGPVRLQISVKSYVSGVAAGESVEAKRLIRDWNPLWEDAVKAEPKTAKQGSRGYKLDVSVARSSIDTIFYFRADLEVKVGAILEAEANGEQLLVLTRTAPEDPAALPSDPYYKYKISQAVTVTRAYNGTGPFDVDANQVFTWIMPGVEWVFRRYRLPACLRAYHVRSENVVRRTTNNTEALDKQAWKFATRLDSTDIDEDNKLLGTVESTPRKKHAVFHMDKGIVEFAEPQLNASELTLTGDGKPRITWVEAVAGVTVTIDYGTGWSYDTGTVYSDVGSQWDTEGLVGAFERTDLVYSQVCSDGFAIADAAGTAVEPFDCWWFDDDGTAIVQSATAAVIVEDDRSKMRAAAQEMLLARSRRHHSYDVDVPWYSRGFRLGQRVGISGVDYADEAGPLAVTGLEIEMPVGGDHRVGLTLDNVKAPKRREYGSGGARSLGGRGMKAGAGGERAQVKPRAKVDDKVDTWGAGHGAGGLKGAARTPVGQEPWSKVEGKDYLDAVKKTAATVGKGALAVGAGGAGVSARVGAEAGLYVAEQYKDLRNDQQLGGIVKGGEKFAAAMLPGVSSTIKALGAGVGTAKAGASYVKGNAGQLGYQAAVGAGKVAARMASPVTTAGKIGFSVMKAAASPLQTAKEATSAVSTVGREIRETASNLF